MRRYSFECGADKPNTLRGTILRKHVATLGVNLNLTDSEIADLANFMGHEEKIHREHYRMPIVHREILRMSRLLQSASGKDCENKNNVNNEKEDYQDVNNAFEDNATLNYNHTISLETSCIIMQDKENQYNKEPGREEQQNLSVDNRDTAQLRVILIQAIVILTHRKNISLRRNVVLRASSCLRTAASGCFSF